MSKARFRWAWAVGFSLLISPSRALAQGADPGSGVDPIAPYPQNVPRDLRRQYESNGGKERVAKVPSFPASTTKAGAAGPASHYPRTTRYYPQLRSGQGPNHNMVVPRARAGVGMPNMPGMYPGAGFR
jgi:hypothetical protein